MSRTVVTTLACLAGLLALPFPADAQNVEEIHVGDVVVVLRETPVKVESETVYTHHPGIHLKVGAVQGDWLWVTYRKAGWIRRQDVRDLDEAIRHFTDLIQAGPPKSETYNSRGILWNEKGEYDIAIRDFDDAITLNSQNAAAFGNRAIAWRRKANCEKSLADYNEAIRLNPASPTLYRNRGITQRCLGNYEAALADFNEAIRIAPDQAEGYNSRAWLMATCPNAKFRNGDKAVEDARKACEMTAWKHAHALGTLAAAYAELGKFDQAETWQAKSQDLVSDDERQEAERLLELFKAGQPYRDAGTTTIASSTPAPSPATQP